VAPYNQNCVNISLAKLPKKYEGKNCFVVSPIGAPDSDIRNHADDVFQFIIEPAIANFSKKHGIPFETMRADHQEETGRITEQMFEKILEADLCIAILTDNNANVFYELAIAQTAARPVIILIEDGQVPPFDVKDLRCIYYKLQPVHELVKGVYADDVCNMINNIHAVGWSVPSLFEQYGYAQQMRYEQQLQDIIAKTRPATLPTSSKEFTVEGLAGDQRIVLATGDIQELGEHRPTVVVSPESMYMQLARYGDLAISGILRSMDAERSSGGMIIRDSLNECLQELIKTKKINLPVSPASVLATPTDQLAKCGVRYVFHVAALEGSRGAGYRTPTHLLDDCVRTCFNQLAELSSKDKTINSILFPMIGAGSTQLGPQDVAEQILKPSIKKMQLTPSCKTFYLLAWIEPHQFALMEAAKKLGLKQLPVDESAATAKPKTKRKSPAN
jgi:O-acetyl-ADP-ribose deacetylase (regulator of RNase III)